MRTFTQINMLILLFFTFSLQAGIVNNTDSLLVEKEKPTVNYGGVILNLITYNPPYKPTNECHDSDVIIENRDVVDDIVWTFHDDVLGFYLKGDYVNLIESQIVPPKNGIGFEYNYDCTDPEEKDLFVRQNLMYYTNKACWWLEDISNSYELGLEVPRDILISYDATGSAYPLKDENWFQFGGGLAEGGQDPDLAVFTTFDFGIMKSNFSQYEQLPNNLFEGESVYQGISYLLTYMFWEDENNDFADDIFFPYFENTDLDRILVDPLNESIHGDQGISDESARDVWLSTLMGMYDLFKIERDQEQARKTLLNIIIPTLSSIEGPGTQANLMRVLQIELAKQAESRTISLEEYSAIRCLMNEKYAGLNAYLPDSQKFLSPLVINFCEELNYFQYQVYGALTVDSTDCSGGDLFAIEGIRWVYKGDTVAYSSPFAEQLSLPWLTDSFEIIPTEGVNAPYRIRPEKIVLDSNKIANGINEEGVYGDTVCAVVTAEELGYDVYMIPEGEARPGFEQKYKVVIKNISVNEIEGELELEYESRYMEILSGPMGYDQEANKLRWNTGKIKPFEKVSYSIEVELNRPTDNPSLNGGDELSYGLKLLEDGEELAKYNWEETVVNSFDPNDKRCMEGEILRPEEVGKSLLYRIRFENTGSASAIHVRIADTLDEEVYEVETVELLESSHRCYMAREGNVIQIYFEDINLPFDDANNDGYVFIRIKTREDLALGDRLVNRAGIYFDFNYPIITDEAITEVMEPNSTKNQEREKEVHFYPNPTRNKLYWNPNLIALPIQIYDAEGKLLRVHETSQAIDVSSLSKGWYILEWEKGGKIERQRFIKQ